MFSRSSRKGGRKVVSKPATVEIIKPEQSKPAIDLSKAKITIEKPNKGLKVLVEEKEDKEGEEDE